MSDKWAQGGLVNPNDIVDSNDCDLVIYPMDCKKMKKLIEMCLPKRLRP
jgi:hypothetical protein